MKHNLIYLIYTLVLFLVGLGFFIVGEFNRVEKPVLKNPDMIGKEEETEPDPQGVSELSGDEVEMPVPEPEETTLEDISLDNEPEHDETDESGEEGEGEEKEEPEEPIYDGHEEERIELIKENYIETEKYDSNRWTIYFSVVFWVLSLVCAILYFTS